MKEYIIRRYIKEDMQYSIIPKDQMPDTERMGTIELPNGIPEDTKKFLLEMINDKSASKTIYQEEEEIRVSEGYGPAEIADYKVIFGNVNKELTYPNSTPNSNKAWNYKHYTLTPVDSKGAVVIETVLRIIGTYKVKKIFVIPSLENKEPSLIHE